MDEELWQDIPAHPNYQASSLGRVRSKDRVILVHRADGTVRTQHWKSIILSQTIGANGTSQYPQVSLWYHKRESKVSVHRIIAEVFVPNPDGKPEVNHMDGDKTNPHPSNLEWVTAKENTAHALRLGLKNSYRYHRS